MISENDDRKEDKSLEINPGENAQEFESTEPEAQDTEPVIAEAAVLPADEETEIPSERTEAPEEAAAPEKEDAPSLCLFNIPPQLEKLDLISDEEFWHGAAAAVAKKRRKPSAVVIILAVLMAIIMAFVLLVIINGKGWLLNLISGDDYMHFTLPIAEVPDSERLLVDESGRYTAEGLAEAVSPSVVTLEMYKEAYGLVPFSQGSGIVMTSDGYIVTNAHVVEGAEKIKAILYDGTEYSAKVIGTDAATDIAVIKVAAADLKPAVFGDSTALHIGEEVVAIGSPAGFYGSVTKGVVSGVNRKIRVEEYSTAMNCIQIDAAINPGNSGGALFNMWGQVVGITSSKLASKKYEGIGFAISIEAAKPVIEKLIEQGYTPDKPRIGITYYAISEETAKMYDIKPGLMIVAIDAKADIANTQLQKNDIITELDGEAVSSTDQVAEILSSKKPRDTMTANIYRMLENGAFEEFEISFEVVEDQGEFIKK